MRRTSHLLIPHPIGRIFQQLHRDNVRVDACDLAGHHNSLRSDLVLVIFQSLAKLICTRMQGVRVITEARSRGKEKSLSRLHLQVSATFINLCALNANSQLPEPLHKLQTFVHSFSFLTDVQIRETFAHDNKILGETSTKNPLLPPRAHLSTSLVTNFGQHLGQHLHVFFCRNKRRHHRNFQVLLPSKKKYLKFPLPAPLVQTARSSAPTGPFSSALLGSCH